MSVFWYQVYQARRENTCWHCEACRVIHHAFLKPSLVNMISNDANLVFYLSVYTGPSQHFTVMSGWVFLGWTSTKQGLTFCWILYVPVNNFSAMSGSSWVEGLMRLDKGHRAVMPVMLEPAALLSPVKHFTIEPLCSLVTELQTVSILVHWLAQLFWYKCSKKICFPRKYLLV